MLHEVVIIGGGFGGVRAAKILAKEKNLHITLIDKSRYHTYHPNLYEAATAHLTEVFGHLPLNFFDLKSSAIHPLEDIFLDDQNAEVVEDEVTGVDFKKRLVALKNHSPHKYDILVLGAGSETNYFNVSGMEAKALPLKSFFDALRIRNAVDEIFFRSPKNHIIKIVIGGGGFTGCELAGEMVGYLKKLSKTHGRPEYYSECVVVEAADALLGGASRWVGGRAKKRLESLGVKFKFKSGVKAVEDGTIILEDKSKMPYDVLIWTAGVKASGLTKSLPGVKLEKNASVAVDKNLRVAPHENVFGVGDIAYSLDEETGKPLPMTASVALREAKCVAENVKRTVLKKRLKKYKPRHAGFIIPLGGRYAIFESHGIKFSGIIPWAIKQLITLHYWGALLGWRRAYGLWRKGLEVYARND